MLSFFSSDDARRNPYPMYDQMRRSSPVLHVPQANLWMLFDYPSVRRALQDHEAFSSDLSLAGHGTLGWLIFSDPPRHTKLRALIMRAFTPGAVAKLEPRIRELARTLLDRWMGHDTLDLVNDFSVPLPLMVIAELLGAPADDWPQFKRWSDVIVALSDTVAGGAAGMEAAGAFRGVHGEMSVYLTDLVEQRRSAPTDDVLSKLIAADVDGERLTEDELLGFFQLLLLAGHETTTNLINNAFLCLGAHPEQQARLRVEPTLLPGAIEEVLRYRSPVQAMFRATRHEVELHGQVIPPRSLVLAMIGSANHDPAQFHDSDRFDITRDPNPHIAFGHGIHFCIGAPLARLESRVALAELLARLPNFERADDSPWEPRKAFHVHGPTRLDIRFGAAAPA
ncbi:MAG TPA: cytochrome P450 [Herpetosiphonaceae bacterium]